MKHGNQNKQADVMLILNPYLSIHLLVHVTSTHFSFSLFSSFFFNNNLFNFLLIFSFFKFYLKTRFSPFPPFLLLQYLSSTLLLLTLTFSLMNMIRGQKRFNKNNFGLGIIKNGNNKIRLGLELWGIQNWKSM